MHSPDAGGGVPTSSAVRSRGRNRHGGCMLAAPLISGGGHRDCRRSFLHGCLDSSRSSPRGYCIRLSFALSPFSSVSVTILDYHTPLLFAIATWPLRIIMPTSKLLHLSCIASYMLPALSHPASQVPLSVRDNSLLIEDFNNTDTNSLGFWHGITKDQVDGAFTTVGGAACLKFDTADVDCKCLASGVIQ